MKEKLVYDCVKYYKWEWLLVLLFLYFDVINVRIILRYVIIGRQKATLSIEKESLQKSVNFCLKNLLFTVSL